MTLGITIYGSHTCDDTAFVRDRFKALDIPFLEHDREDDPGVESVLEKASPGSPRTPTIVFGKDDLVLVEPSVRELEDALTRAGYEFHAPQGVQFGSLLSSRVSPDFRLPSSNGEMLDLMQLRGSRRAVLSFGHDEACRVCQGYARQLMRMRGAFDEAEARLLFVLQADAEKARRWSEEFAGRSETLADSNASVKVKYVDYFSSSLGAHLEGTMLLVLDRFTAPRVGLYAREAGGQLAPDEAAKWLELLECECDE